MKRMYPVLFLFFATMTVAPIFAQNNNVGIGTTTPAASAALDVTSTTQGMLVPRLTTAQRTGIANPAQGLLVYDTNLGCFYYYNLTTWVSLCQAGPAGPAGPQGPTGALGTNGVTGPSGVDGVTGPSGADGANGATGIQGVAGASGVDGIDGVTGATGPIGPIGPGGAGSLGPTGANGAVGPTGPQGVPGVAGPTGINGTTGATGIAGTPGTPGVTGPSGAAGPTGAGAALNIQSVSLTTTQTLTATTNTLIPGMTLTFTPTQSQTFVEFTASGFAEDGSISGVFFTVYVNNIAIVGSEEKASQYTQFGGNGYSNNEWSTSISQLVAVNPNQANTIKVEYSIDAIFGTAGIEIEPGGLNNSHATLTAFVQ